jgi:hypothetical protein
VPPRRVQRQNSDVWIQGQGTRACSAQFVCLTELLNRRERRLTDRPRGRARRESHV